MLTVYLKPTNYCNVGCTHCYLTEEVRANKERMTEETLIQSAIMLEQMRKNLKKDNVHIIWHGGEPLVLKASYFQKMGKLLDFWLPKHTESLQTSLIPLTEEHLPWIKSRLNSMIGSSMDFSARTIKGSNEAYQDLWMKKIKLCRDNGILVIPGVTPSKSEINKAKEIVDWMRQRGFNRFNIERYNSYKFDAPDYPSNKEHSRFLIDLFDSVMGHYKSGHMIYVRVLAAACNGVLNNQPGDRWGGTCQTDFVVIEPNGGLNNCPDKTSKEASYANVEGGFKGFVESTERRKWIRIQVVSHREDHCSECENNSWCKSGCPITCNDKKLEGDCSGYKIFLNYIRDFVSLDQNKQLVLSYLKEYAQSVQQVKTDQYV